MNLFHKLTGTQSLVEKAVSQAVINTLRSSVNQQMQVMGFQSPVYASNDAAGLVKKAFEENIVFYSIVDQIAEKFGHIPRYHIVEKQTKALAENAQDSDIAKLLNNPNDAQGQDSFFYLICLSYLTTGEAFIWKNRGGIEKGRPVELYVLPPWVISPVSDGTLFGVKHYLLEIAGVRAEIAKEDIIHWKKPSLSLNPGTGEHLRGFNPLVPAKKTIQESGDITDASVSMLQNGGAKGVLYNEMLSDLSVEQKRILDNIAKGKINNPELKAAVSILQGKWGYLNLGMSSIDMNLIEADEKVVKKICFLLRFPYELYSGDATHANREQALVFLMTQRLMPLTASLDSEFTRSLVPDFKAKGIIKSDFSDLPEMAYMRLQMAKSLEKEWVIRPNERRNALGYEDDPNPLMNEVWMPNGWIMLKDAALGEPLDDVEDADYQDEGK